MPKFSFKENDNNCFVVTSHKPQKFGHCFITVGSRTNGTRKTTPIHRMVYEECFGEISNKLVVRHKCDNGSCVNPEHLEIGTQADNMNDVKIRNRRKGIKHHNSSLSEEDVRFIKYNSEGYTNKELANRFNIQIRQIYRIKSGERWSHI